jgi:predicted HicB family RNase H-like nuclease
MTDAKAKLTAKIAAMTVEELKELTLRMTLAATKEGVVLNAYAELELKRRVPEAEFLAHMETCDALVELAA